jgi:hypothetical protein
MLFISTIELDFNPIYSLVTLCQGVDTYFIPFPPFKHPIHIKFIFASESLNTELNISI